MNKLTIYAMIPARYGSTRLKMKNLALINNKPMISYAINAASKSGVFDKIFVNSENKIFESIATKYAVDFYHRPKVLGSSEAKSDSVVFDFMEKHPNADIVAWVNPISPFQNQQEISDIVNHFISDNLDSLITVVDQQVHCNFENKPINYDKEELFAQTQDLKPVQTFVYSIMMWRREVFLSEYYEKGHALFCGNFGTYSVDKLSSIIIKTASDLILANNIAVSIEAGTSKNVTYDPLVLNK